MRIYTLLIISIFMVGCATSSNKKGNSAKFTKVLKTKSLSKMPRSLAKKCPRSQTSWNGETWQKQLNLANSCVKAKNWKMLRLIGDNLARQEGNSPWGPYYLSLASLEEKNSPQALWMIDLALKKTPKNGLLHYQKGRVHWSMGNTSLAIYEFETANKYDSTLTNVNIFLGQLYLRDQNYSQAKKHLEEVLKEEPSNYIALSGLGRIHLGERNGEKAVSYLERAVDMKPSKLDLRLLLAFAYENLEKNYQSALYTYRRIATLFSQRKLSGKLSFNLKDKIKTLEDTVGREALNKRVSQRTPAQKKNKG